MHPEKQRKKNNMTSEENHEPFQSQSIPKGPLRTSVQNVLLKTVINSVPKSESGLKALIVDRTALRILSAAMNTNELINYGVSVIELIDLRREPLPTVPAIYFLTPTAETIEQLSEESPRHYKSFRIFFTAHVPEFLMNVFKQKSRFLNRVKSFVELNVRFLALESRLFSLDRPAASLPQVHAPDNLPSKMKEEVSSMSNRLAEICTLVAPKLEWDIRHDALSFTARTLASLVVEELSDLKRKRDRKEKESNGSADNDDDDDDDDSYGSEKFGVGSTENDGMKRHPKAKKATLLIVDRVSDLTTPLVHEYTYQAMAHDLLPLNYRKPGGAHLESDENGKKKSHQIDDEDQDPIWNEIRSLFIEDALKKAQNSFNHFLENDAAYKMRNKGPGEVKIQDMSKAVRALPKAQMKADKHALHIRAARACLETAAGTKLTELALLEQDLIVGRAPDGTKLKSDDMLDRIQAALHDDSFTMSDRVRLLLITLIVAEGLPGLGGEASALSNSVNFQTKVKQYDVKQLLPGLSYEQVASIEGTQRLLHIAGDGYTRLLLKTNPDMVDDGESLTAKLMQRYRTRQIQRRAKNESRLKQERHGLATEDEGMYDVGRYIPPLRSVMMDLVDDALDEIAFPETSNFSVEAIMASLGVTPLNANGLPIEDDHGSQGPSTFGTSSSANTTPTSKEWASGKLGFNRRSRRGDHNHERQHSGRFGHLRIGSRSSDDSSTADGDGPAARSMADPNHLYMVFVLGGVTYSEVRAMHEVCAKRGANVVIGGSDILTPNNFLKQLAAVGDPVIRLQVMLPPLPLELAVIRAPQRKNGPMDSFTPSVVPGGDAAKEKHAEEMDEEFHRQRENVEVVEVVTSYKKKGIKIFGKRLN